MPTDELYVCIAANDCLKGHISYAITCTTIIQMGMLIATRNRRKMLKSHSFSKWRTVCNPKGTSASSCAHHLQITSTNGQFSILCSLVCLFLPTIPTKFIDLHTDFSPIPNDIQICFSFLFILLLVPRILHYSNISI